jgi:hypothetical protein
MPNNGSIKVKLKDGTEMTLFQGKQYQYHSEILEFWGSPKFNTSKDKKIYKFYRNNKTATKTLYRKDLGDLKEL